MNKRRRFAENTRKLKPRGRAFPKGKSPNPGGRPKSHEANVLIREAFEEKGDGVVKALYALAADPDKRIKLAAIREVLDRVLGAPTQGLDVTTVDATATKAEIISELRAELVKNHPKLAEQVAKALGDG